MDWWLITFFIGALLSLFLPIVPALFQLFCLLLFALVFFYYKPLRTSSGLLFAMCWVLLHAWHYQHQLPSELVSMMHDKQSMLIQAEILNLQQPSQVNELQKNNLTQSGKQRLSKSPARKLNVKVLNVNGTTLQQHFIARLSLANEKINMFNPLAQGQVIELTVKLKPAHGLANLGGFNYQMWLKSQNIAATGYVTAPKKIVSQTYNTNPAAYQLSGNASFRQQLFTQYKSLLPEHQLSPLLLALGFGERSELTPEHWQLLQATGTGHLIAISGLHIGLVASSGFFMVMFIIRILPQRALLSLGANSIGFQQRNSRYLAVGFSVLLAFFYGYLAGFSLPTQRALVMLLLYWLSRLCFIKLSLIRWVLMTLFVLVMISPFSLFTASFWLSVYAVVIIFFTLWRFRYYLQGGHSFIRFVKGLVVIQLSLTLLILPVAAVFFQKVSTVALFANLLAVPWMSLFTIPLTLLSVVVMLIESFFAVFFVEPVSYQFSKGLISLSTDSLAFLWQWLSYLADVNYSTINVSLTEQILIILCGGLALWFMFFSRTGSRPRLFIYATLLVSVVCYRFLFTPLLNKAEAAQHNQQPWQVIMFDVGQGLSLLLQRNQHAILYDTGAAYPSGFNMSEAVILPYLQYANISVLDKVILSHSDNDHAGGLLSLSQGVAIKQLVTNDAGIAEQFNDAKNNHTQAVVREPTTVKKIASCHQGSSFSWQGLRFDILSPLASIHNTKQSNDNSCVILISDGRVRVLLTGDISNKVEKQLLQQYPKLNTQILVAPHHGSKTSSSQSFLQQLSPEISLVSAGFLNRWHMPVNEVVERYQDINSPLLNTAISGQIIVTIYKDDITVQSYREHLRPFWFAN
ncbi:DNA internalization-related competence protein ComEC/Rec2 [Colwellia asteriadis]